MGEENFFKNLCLIIIYNGIHYNLIVYRDRKLFHVSNLIKYEI